MKDEDFGLLILFVVFVFFYFLPTIIAFSKQKYQKIALLFTNLFFGWTILGWVICFIWAVMNDAKVIISDERD
jgi:hypothetical protein